MATTEFRVVCKQPALRRRAKVWLDVDPDGNTWFAFAVVEVDGVTLAGCGGADHELTTTDGLVAASYPFLEWVIEINIARQLRALELQKHTPELRDILGQIWAE